VSNQDVSLSTLSVSVTIHESPEEREQKTRGMEVKDTATGPILLIHDATLATMHVVGRLTAKADVITVEGWYDEQMELTYTGRDGVAQTGWRIHGEPAPRIVRKDGDSLDWNVDLRLWRIL
jgi:hypothetical protein